MKIWLRNPPHDIPLSSLDVGRYVINGPAEANVIVELSKPPTREVFAVPVAAWVVPAGLGAARPLLHTLAELAEAPVFVAVNGLGTRSIEAIDSLFTDRSCAFLFDARDQDRIPYFEQLAWLQSRRRPFVIMARSTEKLLEGIVAGAQSLIVPDDADIDLATIDRVAAATRLTASRPMSATEVDHLQGREISLTVRIPYRRGEVLALEDLDVIVASERGLSPNLREHIAGKVLRYDVRPGDPLHFGHLRDKNDE